MQNKETLEEAAERYESTFEEFSQGTESIDFIAGAKSDAARDYWFEKFQKEVENKETLEEVADKLSDELHAVFEMNNEDAFL